MKMNEYVIRSDRRQSLPDPNTSALLLIDLQEYFREIATPIIMNLAQLITRCRQRHVPIIYTQHAHPSPESDGGMLAKWWGDLIIAGTPVANILHELSPEPADKIVHKTRYSAFHNTDLHAYLKEQRIRQVIIAGVMTNLCCETTARDAFVRDYEVFFLADGTATVSDQYHRATLLNLSFGFAHLTTCYDAARSLVSQ
ncbi:MAG: isochorismatase family protein [Candidatus Zhuqueibacterota bacterium]